MSRFQCVHAVVTFLMSALVVHVICPSSGEAAPRDTFPGRRIGGGRWASVPPGRWCTGAFVQRVLLGSANLIALQRGQRPIQCRWRSSCGPHQMTALPLQRFPLAAERWALRESAGAARVPAASSPLLWESSVNGEDEEQMNWFVTASASVPSPCSCLQLLAGWVASAEVGLQAVCGSSTAVAPQASVRLWR